MAWGREPLRPNLHGDNNVAWAFPGASGFHSPSALNRGVGTQTPQLPTPRDWNTRSGFSSAQYEHYKPPAFNTGIGPFPRALQHDRLHGFSGAATTASLGSKHGAGRHLRS